MANNLSLRPTYWASVSGGKDSLKMLEIIFANPDKYPLDGIYHLELDNDYPFIHDIIDELQLRCESMGIRFLRIKPEHDYDYFYNLYGFPSSSARWCNSQYKLSGKKQLQNALKKMGCKVVSYIGYCADEFTRFSNRVLVDEIYPLVDFNIQESEVLAWARDLPIFNDYYKVCDRCGCMYCPLSSIKEMVYLYKHYPDYFFDMIDKMRKTEIAVSSKIGKPFAIRQGNPKYNADYYLNRVIYLANK